MEMVKIKEGVYYIPGSTNIGVISDDDKAILIDTGIDKDIIKKALKEIQSNGLSPIAVINTHSHADHCGGNKYLQDNYKVKIFASELEASIIGDPELEPLYLFSGAKPLLDLENKFLRAEPSSVELMNDGKLQIPYDNNNKMKKTIDIIPLHGHTPKQKGVLVDNVLFCADSYFPKETIEKHKILYHTDIDQTRKTLEWLKNSNFEFYVPSHGKLDTNVKNLVDLNLLHIDDVCGMIKDIVLNESTTEDVIRDACNLSAIQIKNAQQYYLMNTVVMSYLSYLKESGEISFHINDNKFFWKKS